MDIKHVCCFPDVGTLASAFFEKYKNSYVICLLSRRPRWWASGLAREP